MTSSAGEKCGALASLVVLSFIAGCTQMTCGGSILPNTHCDPRPFGALNDLFDDEPDAKPQDKTTEPFIICRNASQIYRRYGSDTCPNGEERVS